MYLGKQQWTKLNFYLNFSWNKYTKWNELDSNIKPNRKYSDNDLLTLIIVSDNDRKIKEKNNGKV